MNVGKSGGPNWKPAISDTKSKKSGKKSSSPSSAKTLDSAAHSNVIKSSMNPERKHQSWKPEYRSGPYHNSKDIGDVVKKTVESTAFNVLKKGAKHKADFHGHF